MRLSAGHSIVPCGSVRPLASGVGDDASRALVRAITSGGRCTSLALHAQCAGHGAQPRLAGPLEAEDVAEGLRDGALARQQAMIAACRLPAVEDRQAPVHEDS